MIRNAFTCLLALCSLDLVFENKLIKLSGWTYFCGYLEAKKYWAEVTLKPMIKAIKENLNGPSDTWYFPQFLRNLYT